jgi:8-oxo-dGTP diphosphatase
MSKITVEMNTMHANPMTIRREYPPCPLTCAHAAVLWGDQVLLVQRANPPSQGRWSLPGGVVELGETFRQAAQREVLEECGVEVEAGPVIDVIDNIVQDESGRVRFHYVITYVLARHLGAHPHPASDALEVRWIRCEDLDTLDMHPLARQALRRAFEMAWDEVQA